MLRQVTVTDLQRNAAKVLGDLGNGPVVVSQRGRPTAVLIDAGTFGEMERALEEAEAKRVMEVVDAGLASFKAGRTSPQSVVAHRVRKARARQ